MTPHPSPTSPKRRDHHCADICGKKGNYWFIIFIAVQLLRFSFSSWVRFSKMHSKNLSISPVFKFIDKKVFIIFSHKLIIICSISPCLLLLLSFPPPPPLFLLPGYQSFQKYCLLTLFILCVIFFPFVLVFIIFLLSKGCPLTFLVVQVRWRWILSHFVCLKKS